MTSARSAVATTRQLSLTSHQPRATSTANHSHARAEELLLAVALDGQSDQTVEQARELDAARSPELRVHADGRETWNRVHFVEVKHPAVACEQKIDARHAGAV